MTYLKKQFEVLSLSFYGPNADWVEASTITAYDEDEAVCIWAEESDCRGDYDIIRYGVHGPILVREVGTETHKEYEVFAEQVAHYHARAK